MNSGTLASETVEISIEPASWPHKLVTWKRQKKLILPFLLDALTILFTLDSDYEVFHDFVQEMTAFVQLLQHHKKGIGMVSKVTMIFGAYVWKYAEHWLGITDCT